MAYLQRVPSSAGNRKTFTMSAWIKPTAGNRTMFSAWSADNVAGHFVWRTKSDGTIGWSRWSEDSYSTRKLRDENAWYHCVIAVDTTQATASNRIKLYVNNEQITSFSVGANYPAQNTDLPVNNATSQTIGLNNYSSSGNAYAGYMSHFHLVDGLQLTPSTFGSTDSTTGEWQINTSPTISDYGTCGFFMFKDDNSANDDSGKGNNFNLNGTLPKSEDCPSNVFATGNPLIGIHSNGSVLVPHTYSNGNLTSTSSGQQWRIHQSTLGASSGKYYAEFKLISNSGTWYSYVGIYDLDGYAQKVSGYPYLSDMANTYGLKDSNGQIHTGGSGTSYGVSYGTGNIIGVAMDLDNNKLYFSKDGTWMNSANPSNGTGGYSITADKTYAFGIQQYAQNSIVWSANYGNGYIGTTEITTNTGTGYQDADGNGRFYYAVPTGFRCLSTKGLNQ